MRALPVRRAVDSVLISGAGRGHPGEDVGVQLYTRHRIHSMFVGGLDCEFIAEYLGLPVQVVRQVVVAELDEERTREY